MDRFAEVVRRDDGLVATYVSGPLANRLLRGLAGTAVTPNQVTAASVVVGLVGAGLLATGGARAGLAAALLIQLSFVLDCLDGQLARFRGASTIFGSWLDRLTDRVLEALVLIAVATGSYRATGDVGVLFWGYAALVVVLYRHVDGALLRELLGEDYRRLIGEPTSSPDDPDRARIAAEARARARSNWGILGQVLDALAPRGTQGSRRGLYWAKRGALLDGGERYLLISILAALGHPGAALPVIAVWGGVVYPLITLRRWTLFGRR